MRQLRKRSEAGAPSLADQLAASVGGSRDPLPNAGTIPAPPQPATSVVEHAYPPQPAREPPPLYASANLGDGVSPDFARIVETTYAADVFADYEDLEKNLEVGENRGDNGALREHLDKAEARARRAHRLYLGAKLELVKWELDAKKVDAAMRKEATDALAGDKDRAKRITNDDVDAKVVDMFPDEVEAQAIRRAKLKGVVDDLEHLVRRWDMKCGDLRTLLETLRR